ncbi:MAG: putative acyl-CoA thioesterase YneP, partial [Bacteroidota bacterium]
MIQHSISIRVRYAETDAMNFVYYGNYATYFEVARVELMRKLGLSYRAIEEMGVWMPVIDFHIQYFKPAQYDDEVTIQVKVDTMPSVKMIFHYESFVDGTCINRAETTLVFVDAQSKKPQRCPEILLE